ncbi:nucleoside-diphosphate sugar epimerase/dehydratase [Ammoniphilus sp. CFH 90114]|uniref:polysaccharide biosynthesis protein n=1 Tax=Ammoniphilus sp. CFH 90114 TaxID=2493665 RepID=UPI00100E9DFC|nr:nucleoside-diphosphate sugar epimerase/dehydratase [Ammoniphilus sp. CFH 90114]RXT03682.1 polysaccharide biosynthesis protein [Ammoniphilus sp. CFH 90114]
MTYQKRLLTLILIDSIIVLSSIYVSHYILVPKERPGLVIAVSSLVLFFSHHYFASRYKLYKRVWKYASVGELISVFKGVTFSILIALLVQFALVQELYYRAMIITWMMHIIFIGGVRFSWRLYRDSHVSKVDNSHKKRALIVGAGAAGTMIARQLKQNPNAELYPVAFIDDDPTKHKLEILGLPVMGGREQIETVVKELEVDNIIIAIPSLNKKELNLIVGEANKTRAKTQIVPMIEDLMTGKVAVSDFRDVQVEDLLGREPVQLDSDSIAEYLTGNVILVTGAGGSIGSEVCRQVSKFKPRTLILLGHGENSIHSIELELKANNVNDVEYITEIADVQDREKMFHIMGKHQPHVVFHAAAHKHVPLMERNPEEAVKNNIIGTKNVADAADVHHVETFVMISTDKAVNPTNVMGSTKRLAEMIIQDLDKRSDTRFVAVRFGNVLGSRGSVIPLFKEQIKKGGPVTVTDPEMKRYFMTIPEASRLVLQAGALAEGGEIFVLDMGEPVKIVDLARNLIRLSGYTEDEIPIHFSGIRPGEKLFEELLNENEVHDHQVYPKIYIGKTSNLYIHEIYEIIENVDMDTQVLRKRLLDLANNRVEAKKLVSLAK